MSDSGSFPLRGERKIEEIGRNRAFPPGLKGGVGAVSISSPADLCGATYTRRPSRRQSTRTLCFLCAKDTEAGRAPPVSSRRGKIAHALASTSHSAHRELDSQVSDLRNHCRFESCSLPRGIPKSAISGRHLRRSVGAPERPRLSQAPSDRRELLASHAPGCERVDCGTRSPSLQGEILIVLGMRAPPF